MKQAVRPIFCLLSVICSAVCNHYYVLPSNNPNGCGDSYPCYNLSYYVDNSELYFTNDTIFNFLEGTHILEQDELLEISEVSNLTLQGMGTRTQGCHETVRESTVKITCKHQASGILIIDSENVEISGITIVNCGGYLPEYVVGDISKTRGQLNLYNWSDIALALAFIRTQSINLKSISVQNSTSYGLVGINAFNVRINDSSFAENNLDRYSNCSEDDCIGGNTLLAYTVFEEECSSEHITYTTSITHTNFSFGFNTGSYNHISASGLSIYMEQATFGIDVSIDFTVFFGNTGVKSANFRYVIASNVLYHSLTIRNARSVYGNEIYKLKNVNYRHVYGSGLTIYLGLRNKHQGLNCFNTSILNIQKVPVRIYNSQILHNHATFGTGISIHCNHPSSEMASQTVLIKSCEIRNNSGYAGAGLLLTQTSGLNFKVIFTNVTVAGSRYFHPHDISTSHTHVESAVLLRRTLNATFIDFSVLDNPTTGMTLVSAILCFSGHSIYQNNTGKNGGAIRMYGDSSLVFLPPVHVSFINNSAINKGGALYVSAIPYIKLPCFFSPYDPTLNSNNISVTFSGNTAKLAGSVLYGGSIDTCYISAPSMFVRRFRHLTLGAPAFNYVVHIENQPGVSVISSDPEQVCFCFGGQPNCSIKSLNFSVFPGDSEVISVVTVGQRYGVSPGVIEIEEWDTLLMSLVHKSLESTETECKDIHYYPNVNASAQLPGLQLLHLFLPGEYPEKLQIFFHIESCPLGFQLSQSKTKCTCTPEILQIPNITCDTATQTFSHSGNHWLGYENCLIARPSCSFDYCRSSYVNFTLTNPDNQCAFNRSGILCGQCAEGLSLMLGSNQCGHCTNDYLTLIIPFVLAGIVLVAFLTSLNLTVSAGSINGLIFYANIVKINETIFFPNTSPPILRQFISWINLDLGISVCFFNGMTSYAKIWLQFAFPFYLWTIVLLIIFLSHYSYKVSKLMGSHSISVLATVILLSFTKLFRTCILVFQIAYLECGGNRLSVWAVDANVPYWSTPHLIMMLFAIFVTLFFILPYTLLLLFSPLIERHFSRYRCCKGWVKLKPLFDAYNGPYRDGYRFWTGLLLLVRLVLVQVFAFNTDDTTTGVAIITTTAILFTISNISSGLYRCKFNNFLECWFLLNVIVIAAASISEITLNAVFVSVAIAFLTFVLLVICHFLVRSGLYAKLHPYLMEFYRQHTKKETQQEQTDLPSMQIDLLDDRLTEVHESIGLRHHIIYRDGSVFVSRRRETLLNNNESNYRLYDDQ